MRLPYIVPDSPAWLEAARRRSMRWEVDKMSTATLVTVLVSDAKWIATHYDTSPGLITYHVLKVRMVRNELRRRAQHESLASALSKWAVLPPHLKS